MTLNHCEGIREDINAPLNAIRKAANAKAHEDIIHITKHKAVGMTCRDLGLGIEWV